MQRPLKHALKTAGADNVRKTELAVLGLIALSFVMAAYFYPQMPERIASHWNAAGEADGYMSKNVALFLLPAVALFMLVLLVILPRIDPLRKNIEKFRKHFDGFIFVIVLFLLYIHLLSIFWNLGNRFDMTIAMLPALAVLFFYMGILLENAKRNWFIGIRTPWTLSSDEVWDKTHRLGAKLFKVSAFLTLSGMIFRDYAILLVLLPVLVSSAWAVLYSYLEYRKLAP